MKIMIATIKSWNIQLAEAFQQRYGDKHEIVTVNCKEALEPEKIQKFHPDYIFFPHWSYFIPPEIYEQYPCVVFHMTDLPFGRGGSPLQNLIVRGYKTTKISAIQVVKELDAGAVYLKETLPLEGSADEIYRRAAKIIFEVMIPKFLEGNLVPVPQTGEITSFSRRKPGESQLAPEMDMEKLYDYIRMLDAEGYPNAFIMLGNKKLSFTKAKLSNNKIEACVMIEELGGR